MVMRPEIVLRVTRRQHEILGNVPLGKFALVQLLHFAQSHDDVLGRLHFVALGTMSAL